MTTKQYSYENDVLRVNFNGKICAHAGYCFKELHDVFDGDRNPPIDLSGGSIDEIVRVVELCPSSALTYQRLDEAAEESAATIATATIVPKGPLAIRGKIKLDDQVYTRVTLCRCGKSKIKPYCDGSHHRHKFDDGQVMANETTTGTLTDAKVLLTAIPNGPVLFDGDLCFSTISGDKKCTRNQGAICRCGVSKNKPFCDGSHSGIDFKTA